MALAVQALGEIDAASGLRFGGKARGLAQLLAAGAAVPEGFAVEAARLDPRAWDAPTRADFLERTEKLLALGPIVVRSSALGEDAADRSFAGLFDSVLDVTTADEALAAAGRVVASGSGERVRAYAAGGEPAPVGLVVQRHVAARAAGVCFTRDPTGRDRAVVVEATSGTGERLVSGHAQPERWRAYRNGLGTWELRRERGGPEVLESPETEAIVVQALRWAAAFGHALDLEWALDGPGSLLWLQARPITAAAEPRQPVIRRYCEGVDDGPVTVWANWNLREVLPAPIPPLLWTLWKDDLIPLVAELLFGVTRDSPLFRRVIPIDLVEGRVHWNMNALMAVPFLGRLMRGLLAVMDARAGATTKELLRSGVLTPRKLPSSGTLRWATARSALRSLAGLIVAPGPREYIARLAEAAARIGARPEVARLTDDELLGEVRLFGSPEAEAFRAGHQVMVRGMAVLGASELVFRSHPEARGRLAQGLPDNPTTEISVAVDDLVAAARPLRNAFDQAPTTEGLLELLRQTDDGRRWLGSFGDFLSRYGQRAPGEFDFLVPRWSEDPSMILGLVRAGLQSPEGESVRSRLQRLYREREEAIRQAVEEAPFWRKGLMRRLARLTEEFMPVREAPKHHVMVAFRRVREACLELGARLSARGHLDVREDVFFLEWEELVRLVTDGTPMVGLGAAIKERQETVQGFRARRTASFLRSDGVPVDEDEGHLVDGALRGTAVSPGRAEGPVKILRQPDASLMDAGDVLVLEFADPGWTPLFPRAAAVVMEVGGSLCHAAVVVRELGIPAVFGATDATRILRDGQRVVVDGNRGLVEVA